MSASVLDDSSGGQAGEAAGAASPDVDSGDTVEAVVRIAAYADQARRDRLPALVEAWAELQTERLMLTILERPRISLRRPAA